MSRHLSPGGQLLRTSRLFSVPPPLPRPVLEIPMAGRSDRFNDSDTATLPYPTRQAIATPHSSLNQGDWGLKRALPIAQTTKTTDPTIRIIELDSLEHITDYEAANDHVKTLEKFQELGIGVRREFSRTGMDLNSINAFEKTIDNTAAERKDVLGKPLQKFSATLRNGDRRWKYKGPNLSTMSGGEFEKFMRSKVIPGKSKFAEELGTSLENRWLKSMIRKVETDLKVDSGKADPGELDPGRELWIRSQFLNWLQSLDSSALSALARNEFAKEQERRTEAQRIRDTLRQSNGYSLTEPQASKAAGDGRLLSFGDYLSDSSASQDAQTQQSEFKPTSQTLTEAERLIDEFQNQWKSGRQEYVDEFGREIRERLVKADLNSSLGNHIIEYFDMPKPETLREASKTTESITDRSLSTHPSLGLSYLRTGSILDNHPVRGPLAQRVPVEARVLKARTGGNRTTYLGLAGFVTGEPSGTTNNAVEKLDVKSTGGHRHWVVPTSASVRSDGRVRVHLDNALPISVQIRQGQIDEGPMLKRVSPRSNPSAPLDTFEAEPIKGEPSAALKNMNNTIADVEKRFANSNPYPSR